MAEARISLRGVSTQVEGLQWDFAGTVRIGRDPRVELVLQHPSVSAQHAEIVSTRHGWIIRDLKSTRGTSVNGVPVAGAERLLQAGDLMQFGSCILRVAALEQPPPELPPPTPARRASVKTTQAFVTIQAATQRSWEQGLEALARHDDARLPQGGHLLTLLRGGYHLSQVTSLDEMLRSVLEDTVAVLDAQRGAFLLADPVSGTLSPRCATPEASDGPIFSRTLAQRSFAKGESMLCQDADDDADLNSSGEAARGGMASVICALLRSPRKRLGILYLDRGDHQAKFTPDDVHLADAIAASLSVGIECAFAVERHHDATVRELIGLTSRVLGLLDPETVEHSERVSALALMLAEEMRVPQADRRWLETAARFHELGAVAYRACGRDRMGPAEAHHLAAAEALLRENNELAPMMPILRAQTEHWDGNGQPDGLDRERIPMPARIVAAADAYDSMITGRGDWNRQPAPEALAELQRLSGLQFDPACVKAFVQLGGRAEELYTRTTKLERAPGAARVEPASASLW